MQQLPRTTLAEILKLHNERKLVGAFNLSNADYHASPGLSRSALMLMLNESPWHWKRSLGVELEPTEALIFGSYYHGILDNEELLNFYLTDTQPRDPKKDEKGRLPIAKRHVKTIQEMWTAFMADPICARAVDPREGLSEVAFFWTDPATNVLLKCKVDRIMRHGVIADLKTTSDCSDKAISKSIADHEYDVQGVMQLDGVRLALEQSGQDIGIEIDDLRLMKFLLIFQEKKNGYDRNYRTLCPNSITRGEEIYRTALELYATCLRDNRWPGKSGGVIKEISTPGYHLMQRNI